MRADVTTAYRVDNANPPHVSKRDSRKKEADRGATSTANQRAAAKSTIEKVSVGGAAVSPAEARRKPAAGSKGRVLDATDTYVHSPAVALAKPGEKATYQSTPVTGAPTAPRRAHRSNTAESEQPTPQTADMQGGHEAGEDIGVEGSASAAQPALQSDDTSFFRSVSPYIHFAEPVAKPQMGNPNAKDTSPATGVFTGKDATSAELKSMSASETALQNTLALALNFGQTSGSPPESERQYDDMVRYLQSEGVFGISPSGRSLGAVDFIRQKQFEYEMDQRPFTNDDLLTETERAIYGTLSSAQSSSVAKPLMQAAESVNAYRNQALKTDERRETAMGAAKVRATTGRNQP